MVLYNLKKIDEIAQGDSDFIGDILNTFVENVTTEVERIQLFKSDENWTAIAESAHKLASNFAYLGANTLQVLALDIEKSVFNDNNLFGIAEKANKLCDGSSFLVSQLQKDFCILNKN